MAWYYLKQLPSEEWGQTVTVQLPSTLSDTAAQAGTGLIDWLLRTKGYKLDHHRPQSQAPVAESLRLPPATHGGSNGLSKPPT
jgi:hypothetical protein